MKHARNPLSADVVERACPPVSVFTTKHGLPQNTIATIAFDTRGYLWVGTQDGAARYNGRTWLAVPMPNRTRSNFVGALTGSSDGSMWFGTNGGGVCHLRRGKWEVHSTESGALANDQVRCLLETSGPSGEPVLWVGTRSGLARHERGRWTQFGVEQGLPDPVVRSLAVARGIDGARALWIGTRGGLVCVEQSQWTVFDKASGLPAGAVTCLLESADPDGTPVLWAGTEGGGLARLVNRQWAVVDASSGLPDDGVRCLHETRGTGGARVLWVGTDGGLGRLEGGRWSCLDAKSGLPQNVIMSLQSEGGAGGASAVWAGTMGGGVARVDIGRWLSVDTRSGLPSNSVWSLMETRERAVWMGTLDSGVARFARGEWTVFDTASGLPDNFVLSLLEAGPEGDRAVWIGTLGGGLARRSASGEWTVYDTSSGLPHDAILSLLETVAADGTRAVWAGTNGGGLARFARGRWTVFDTASGLPNNVVSCLVETAGPGGARHLWAGTNGGGLARYDAGVWSVVDSRAGLPNDLVMGLAEVRGPTGERQLWVGTHGGGVAWTDLDARKPRWDSLSSSTDPAISSDIVYQIRQDRLGRVYLFTNRGVDRLTPRRAAAGAPAGFDVYSFTAEDGLPASECNSPAALVDSRGRVWAGTGEGAAVLDPAAEIPVAEARTVRIERARVAGRGRDLAPREALSHDENDLVFEYALLSFFREESTRYRTQLVGFDRRPSEWTADWKRAYTNLPEGDYVFKVWARDYAGTVSGPATLPFRVRPAPWRTWWAYGLYAGTAIGAGYAGIRYRLEALRRRNEELEAAIAERTAQLAEKVDELQASERRALDSERRALDANLAKSVFLSSMSHELRTPLNAILGFVQVMQHAAGRDVEDRENLEIISRSGEHLLGLINDVLSISKIEAGKLTLNEQPFDLRLLLRGIEEMIRVRAHGKGLALDVDVGGDVPRYVRGDEGKLRQVLINLLGNAVKFTASGGVSLAVTWRDGVGHFEVADTGFGIAEDEIGMLFQPFQQTESGHRTTEGTGLGLAISRNFVQLMGGDISVRSTLGKGSAFTFDATLPASDGPDTRAVARRVVGLEEGQRVYRLVVVDDAAANRLLLRKLLEPLGFEVREASTGVEAIDVWERWRPDLIWMDSRLPEMSGVEATAEIRRREVVSGQWPVVSEEARSSSQPEPSSTDHWPLTTGHCKIVALTASAFEHDREAFLRAGCDGFVAKPYREEEILETLEAQLGVRFRYESAAPASAAAPAQVAITPERLATLPGAALEELREAAEQGDLELAHAAIDGVREHDEPLADELRVLVRGYRFDELLDLVEAHGSGSGSDRVDPER